MKITKQNCLISFLSNYAQLHIAYYLHFFQINIFIDIDVVNYLQISGMYIHCLNVYIVQDYCTNSEVVRLENIWGLLQQIFYGPVTQQNSIKSLKKQIGEGNGKTT